MENRTTADNAALKTAEVIWDPSFLYSGIDDPRLDGDIAAFATRAAAFRDRFRGKLAADLGPALTAYGEMLSLQAKVGIYLGLRLRENTGDAAVKAKAAETDRLLARTVGECLTFFELEIVSLDDETLTRLTAADAVVARHRPWLGQVRVFKPHVLSEPVEAALTTRSPFGPAAWDELFDELEAGLSVSFRGTTTTLAEALHVMSESKDAAERAEVLAGVHAALGGAFETYAAQTLYVVAGRAAVERRERGYAHPMGHRNLENRIPDAVVDALHRAVRETAGPLTKRFYRLKAAHLGLEKLTWSDRNASLPFADTSVLPFDEALATVLAAYESFSPTLAGLIREFAAKKRMHAPVLPGKQSGAFSMSSVLPGGAPVAFTFLNYLGSRRDVMTLAHEFGHSAHGMLAGEAQGPLMSDTPISFCETASVFGEMTTFNFLKSQAAAVGDPKALLALVMGKLDDMINTVVRQISFSDFERRLHGMDASFSAWNEPPKRSAGELGALWLETLVPYYGAEGEVFTYANAERLWAYIPHFHRPFYVYGYAFGELLTQSLYAARPTLGDRFEPLYLDMLRAGGTKNAVDLLAPFGLDPRDPIFWEKGIALSIGVLVEEAERLSQALGVSAHA